MIPEKIKKSAFRIGLALNGIAVMTDDETHEKIKGRLKEIENEVTFLVNANEYEPDMEDLAAFADKQGLRLVTKEEHKQLMDFLTKRGTFKEGENAG